MADTIRVILHVSAALVWVGVFGFALAETDERPTRSSLTIAWLAYLVVVASGMWGAATASVPTASLTVQAMLLLKIGAAIASGATGAGAMVTGRPAVRSAMMVATIGLAFVAAVLGFFVAPAI